MELLATEEFFNKHSSGKHGLQPRCKECKRKENRQFILENPENKKQWDKKYAQSHPEVHRSASLKYARSEKGKRNVKKNWLENKYGLTEEQYQSIWNKQNGLCAICEKLEEITNRLHVDHCHATNTIRGLLCGKCNRGLGMFNDNKSLLIKAIGYLDQPEKQANIPVKTDFKPSRREDVSDDILEQLRETGLSFVKIGEIVGMSGGGVRRRLLAKSQNEGASV